MTDEKPWKRRGSICLLWVAAFALLAVAGCRSDAGAPAGKKPQRRTRRARRTRRSSKQAGIACPNCSGRGEVACPKCRGVGGMVVLRYVNELPKRVWMPCGNCNLSRKTVKCPRCDGAGTIAAPAPK